MNPVTHFEIYADEPSGLAGFYSKVFGWEVEQMPGIDYWRISAGSNDAIPVNGGLTLRSIPGLNGWLVYVQVASVDETTELVKSLGGSIVRSKTAVPRTAWVTILADPSKNIFGVWQAEPNAFPPPKPD